MHAPSIVGSYKIGFIEIENIDPHINLCTASATAAADALWARNDIRLWLYFEFHGSAEGVFHTQTSNLI